MKQITIKVEGFVTLTVSRAINPNSIPISLDVYEDDCPAVVEVNETDITSKEIVGVTDVK